MEMLVYLKIHLKGQIFYQMVSLFCSLFYNKTAKLDVLKGLDGDKVGTILYTTPQVYFLNTKVISCL